MERVDLLIDHAAQVVTCAPPGSPPGPLRGAWMADPHVIDDGAVAVDSGRIVDVGPGADLRARYAGFETVDAAGRVVCPGFVDCHTHALFGGSRVAEWEAKLRGVPYLEILAAGGGILDTVRATRAAGLESLVADGRGRLARLLAHGATTVEIKTGYGLNPAAELQLLSAIGLLAGLTPQRLVPTLLAAHAVPPEFTGDGDGYIRQIIDETLPAAAAWYNKSPFAPDGVAPAPFFNDIFVEEHAFTLAQAEKLLRAGEQYGSVPKLHVDQFHALGGTTLAVTLGAASADHLDATPEHEINLIAASPTVAVLLPATIFHTGATRYPPARAFLEAGTAVALATDLNPGSAPTCSLPFVMALACRFMGMSPAQALVACTRNAAFALHLGDCVGSLEPGKAADLLLLDCDDYRELPYWMGESLVAATFIGGRRVWSAPSY